MKSIMHPFYEQNKCNLQICPGDAHYPKGIANYAENPLGYDEIQAKLNNGCDRYCWLLGPRDIVLDMDMHDPAYANGVFSLCKLETDLGISLEENCPAIVVTPGSGLHFCWRMPSAVAGLKALDQTTYPGIDCLGGAFKKSSLVIAAGSTHAKHFGKLYHFKQEEPRLVAPPRELIELMMCDLGGRLDPDQGVDRGRPGDDFNRSLRGVKLLHDAMCRRGYVFRDCGEYLEFDRPGKASSSKCSGFLGKKSERGVYQLTSFSLSDPYFEESGRSITILEAYRKVQDAPISLVIRQLAKQGFGKKFEPIDLGGEPAADVGPAAEPAAEPAADVGAGAEPAVTPLPNMSITLTDLMTSHPQRRPVVVEEIVRRGETILIAAAAKQGKSMFVYGLAHSVAKGSSWLGRYGCDQGRVLIVDTELNREELAHRNREILLADTATSDKIDVLSVAGMNLTIETIREGIRSVISRDSGHRLVVLDALYNTLPEGTSENDNAQMARVMGMLNSIAQEFDVALAIVHHSPKGDQSGKEAIDVAAGAGSLGRSTCSALVLRRHDAGDQYAVMEATCRSFHRLDPVTVEFDWPTWCIQDDIEAKLAKPNQPKAEERMLEQQELLEAMVAGEEEWWTVNRLASEPDVVISARKVKTLLSEMTKTEKVEKSFREWRTDRWADHYRATNQSGGVLSAEEACK